MSRQLSNSKIAAMAGLNENQRGKYYEKAIKDQIKGTRSYHLMK